MPSSLAKRIVFVGCPLLALSFPAFGHLSYSNRNFGIFTGLEPQSLTITGQTVANNWGWADGTDASFGHSHELRFFRFNLQITTSVTITVASLDALAMLPGFSIYSGLAHLPPAGLDYETDFVFQYLATLPGPTKEGAFNALATWRMGNDASTSYDDFSTFTYIGNAADGGAANYGSAAGINGDGVPDGTVTATFLLGPGDYTVGVGGANYDGQGVDTTADGITVTVSTVPEPASGVLTAASVLVIGLRRRRNVAATA